MPTPEELLAIIQPLPKSHYKADYPLSSLEHALKRMEADWGLELNPDYQRGHVWNVDQQIYFVENLIRGAVGDTGKVVQFNHPNWEMNQRTDSDLPDRLQCIDGLQRLTPLLRFSRGEIKPFGLSIEDLNGTPWAPGRIHITLAVYRIQTREELLQYYLDLNTGGTPHHESEINRVHELLIEARGRTKAPKI